MACDSHRKMSEELTAPALFHMLQPLNGLVKVVKY
jgi:hypothetical protein